MADAVGTFDNGVMSGEVRLENVRAIQNLLKEFAPDLRRQMDRNVRKVIEPISNRARGMVPEVALSRWRPQGSGLWGQRLRYDAADARRGVRVGTGGRQRVRVPGVGVTGTTLFAYSLLQANAAGAVYEVAGRRTSGVNSFVSNLNRKHGGASRAIWRAWDSASGDSQVQSEVLDVVTATIQEYNRRLEAE